MGHHQHHSEKQRHEAVDGLLNLFTKANHDLTVIQNKLDREFSQVYPQNANPMKLVARVKKIQEELSSLSEQCRELLAAKQVFDLPERTEALPNFSCSYLDLIDKAKTILVGNRSLLQRLQASTGVPVTDDSNDPSYTCFNQQATEIQEGQGVHVEHRGNKNLAAMDNRGMDSASQIKNRG